MEKEQRMQELVQTLNKAAKAYYQDSQEIMDNYTYDALYDELRALEQETGITLSISPTVNVGYEVLSELPREQHETPMLSLDKTKNVEDLQAWLKEQTGLLSWKMDGLTVVLTYQDGQLQKAVTRGNGEIGEVVTNNARTFVNLPVTVPYKGKLVLRGEAVIPYSVFEQINEQIQETAVQYKNPRNLCSGSVRQLNNAVTAKRNVSFYAFTLVEAEGVDFHNSRQFQLQWLKEQGFEVVEYRVVTAQNIQGVVMDFKQAIEHQDTPSDGLVLTLDDINYGISLGRTAKFPRDSIAFKWADEIEETTLKSIEWSASRTGLINPVAIFEPVELEGTTVSRASVHNVSIVEALALGEGDRIEVYKSNMIIPQIAKNLTRSGTVQIPKTCPVCGGETQIEDTNGAKFLYCINKECPAKKIKGFALFVSRNAMNIEGLSEATLEKLVDMGYIHTFADLYHLDQHREQIVNMEGFGEKSYENLIASIQKSRKTTLARVLYGLGIANIGTATAKLICKKYQDNVSAIIHASAEELADIDGIGSVIAQGIVEYFSNENHIETLQKLLNELELEKQTYTSGGLLEGKTFVITGSLTHYANRNELKAVIESQGGKVAGSVSSKTDYLLTNDKTSGSSKNKKAKELGIPILSEQEFVALLQG
jgi:DNA ligase (NAD+)